MLLLFLFVVVNAEASGGDVFWWREARVTMVFAFAFEYMHLK